MKKIKLFATISTICLALAVFCFGVFSATQVTYTIGGSISYEVTDVFANVKTRVYTSNFNDKDNLSSTVNTIAQTGDVSNFTDTNYEYDFTTNGESQSFDNTENGTKEGINIDYNTKEKRTYFVVVSIKNNGDNTISANVTGKGLNDGANTAFAKSGSIASLTKTENEKRLVLAFMLDDITIGISGRVSFEYVINISNGIEKEKFATISYLNLPKEETSTEFTIEKTEDISEQSYVISNCLVNNLAGEGSGVSAYLLNYSLSNININLFNTLKINIEQTTDASGENGTSNLILTMKNLTVNGADDVMGNLTQNIDGTTQKEDETTGIMDADFKNNGGHITMNQKHPQATLSYKYQLPTDKKIDTINFAMCIVTDSKDPKGSITLSFINVTPPEEDELFRYTKKDDNTWKISAKDNTTLAGDVVIPDEYKGIPVTEIESTNPNKSFKLKEDDKNSYDTSQVSYMHSQAYKTENQFSIKNSTGFLMSDISSLTIGKNIEIIGTFAFASNTGMKSVKFKDGSKLKEIQAYAFFSCISLTDMQDLPEGLEKIGKMAFSDCSISHINIPSTVREISPDFVQQNFYMGGFPWDYRENNKIAINISISNSNTTYACVDNVVYSKDMKTLYTYFQNNGYCSKFVVPETVETIERNAFFYNCDDPILYGDITFTKNVKNFDLSQFTSSDDGFGAKMCQGTITIDSPYLYEQLISNPDYKLAFGVGYGKPFDSVHAIKVLKTIDTDTTNNYFNAEDVNKDTTTDTLYNIYTVS